MLADINIGSLQKSSFLDYPEKICAVVFTLACNFRCGYCHNPELIEQAKGIIDTNSVLEFLKTRVGKLDGVVITGGEPTLQRGLENFISAVKELGFLVKLDTNGFSPDILKKLLDKNLLDYIAMDIKSPLEKYCVVAGVNVNTSKISQSIKLIIESGVDYEFRTTVVKEQLAIDDFKALGELISGAKKYVLQKFIPSKILDENLMNATTYSDAEFENIKTALKANIETVEIR
jgi:pyruvate formate lyase activating enzyme